MTNAKSLTIQQPQGATPATPLVRILGAFDVPGNTQLMALVRMSNPQDREALARHKNALAKELAGTPIGDALSSLADELFVEDAVGGRLRNEAGFSNVRKSHLGGNDSGLLGYAGVVEGGGEPVLILAVPSSAISNDLPAFADDPIHRGRNAFTELVIACIQQLPLSLLATLRMDRAGRNAFFGVQVLENLRDRGVKLWAGHGVRDLMNQTDFTLAMIDLAISGDGAAISIKALTTSGRINATATAPGKQYSSRHTSHYSLALGYRSDFVEDGNGLPIPVKGSVVLHETDTEMIQALWTMYADGNTIAEIRQRMRALGLRTRDRDRVPLAELSDANADSVVRRLLQPKTARLHRTGTFSQTIRTRAPIAELAGHQLEIQPDGTRAVVVEGRFPLHLIDGKPWGIDEDTWAAVERRFATEAEQRPADHGRRRGERPITSSSPWLGPDGHTWRLLNSHASLHIRRSHRPTATPEELKRPSSELIASVNELVALRLLGEALLADLDGLKSGVAALRLPSSVVPGAVATVRQELDQLAAERTALEDHAMRYDQLAAAAVDLAGNQQVRNPTVDAYLRHAIDARTKITQIDERVAACEAQLVAAELAGVAERADLGRPTGVALALIRYDQHESPLVREAIERLGLMTSFRADIDDTTGDLRCSAHYDITLVDGTTVRRPLEWTWPNNNRDQAREPLTRAVVSQWASGSSFTEIAALHGHTEDWAFRQFRQWATRNRLPAAALADHPIPAARQAVVHRVDPALSPAPDLPAATIDFIAAGYLDSPRNWKSWACYSHAADRRLLLALETAGGEADVAPLRVAAGTTGELALKISARTAGRPPLATKSGRARRRLIECPHDDCPSRWASHALYTPETAKWGVICSTCRRVPDTAHRDAHLPAGYEQPWEISPKLTGGTRQATTVCAPPPELADPDLAARMGPLVRVEWLTEALGIATITNRRTDPDLPASCTIDNVEMWDRELLAEYVRRRPKNVELHDRDGRLSVTAAAQLMNVAPSRVHYYVREGLIGYRRVGRRPRISRIAAQRFVVPEGDRRDALSISAAMRESGASREAIKGAIASGALTPVYTSTGTLRIPRADLEDWRTSTASLRRTPPPNTGRSNVHSGELSVSAAAGMLDVSAKQLRRLSDLDVVPSRISEGGWRWYSRVDIDDLVSRGLVGQALLRSASRANG